MQKPNSQDLLRTGGQSIGAIVLMFAIAYSAKIPLQQLFTPIAIGILIAIGLAVSLVDLLIVLGNPERLAHARGEKSRSAVEVQKFQQDFSRAVNVILFGLALLAGLVLVGIIGFSLVWR